LVDPGIGTYEDCDRADMLYNDCRICDKWPKVVGAKAWITLEMIEEGFWISVVVGICMKVCVSDLINFRWVERNAYMLDA
jgi:hypothetical protein